jgi:hypothetical protein
MAKEVLEKMSPFQGGGEIKKKSSSAGQGQRLE